MARPRRTDLATPTGTVQHRHKLEREREQTARAARAQVVAETQEAQAATAKFLKTKPTDTRTIADKR